MNKKHDLTQGGIIGALLRLALPVMGTQFAHMLYNLTDMFWLGRVGSDAVAASGTAGLFIWLSVGFMMIGKIGAEIGVSQSRGSGDTALAYKYARAALYISAVLGLLYGAFMFFFRYPLVGFFNFKAEDAHVAAAMADYMGIMAAGIPLSYISASVSGVFSASGNSRTPFILNCVGLALNIALDPIFIFTLGLEVRGAAIASVLSQSVVTALLLIAVKRFKARPFEEFNFFAGTRFSFKRVWADLRRGLSARLFKWTLPICLESMLFCGLTMITSRFEVGFGAYAIAMSRVGSQVESLTWLVGGGFGSALTVFVGQNFGAGKRERIDKGVKSAALFMTGWGLFVTAILALGGGIIFALFLPEFMADAEMRALCVTYLRILAICQLPMNMEAVAGNAFKGKGRTIPPSVSSIASNILRVPLAYVMSRVFGLLGIWMVISFTACLRGIWIGVWYIFANRAERRKAKEQPAGVKEMRG